MYEYTHIHIYIFTFINIYMYIYVYCHFKWKTEARRFSLIHLLFAQCASGSLSFVHLLTKKQTKVIRLQTD